MNILFFAPYLWWQLHANYEIAFIHNLQSRGHKTKLIACDSFLKECDLYWHATTGGKTSTSCDDCTKFSKNLLNWASIQEDWMGNYISHAELSEITKFVNSIKATDLKDVNWKGYPISEWVISSVHSHFRTNVIDIEDELHVNALRNIILGGIKTASAFISILKSFNPEILVVFNGRMAPTRVALEVATKFGVRTVCHERGLEREYIQFFENAGCLDITKNILIWNKWSKIPLNTFEIAKVNQWHKNRVVGRNFNFKSFNSYDDLGKLQHIALEANKKNWKIWSLFTSSTDELISEKNVFYSSFDSQAEWILSTIEFAREQNNLILFIKVHPNTAGKNAVGNNVGEFNFFNELKNNLPQNVVLIMPEDEVSTYSLIEVTDLGFCSVSTVSIELACEGVPVIASHNSQFTLLDSIEYIHDKHQYHELLNQRLFSNTSPDKLNIKINAFRYIYSNYYRIQLHFPLNQMPNYSTGVLMAKSTFDFRQGNFDCLDAAVDVILGSKPLVPEPHFVPSQSNLELERQTVFNINQRSTTLVTENIFFSVVIPCYNYSNYLERCLLSVLNQTIDNYEIIFIDDGSTDNSLEIAIKVKKEYPHKNFTIVSQNNAGQPAISRNNAIKLAKGKYILPLDADDRIIHSYLEDAYQEILSEPTSLDLLYFDVLFENPTNFNRISPGTFLIKDLAIRNQLCYCSIFKKELWNEVGGYRDNVRGYEDWDFWLACSLLLPNVRRVNKVGLIYNVKEGGLGEDAVSKHDKLYPYIVLNNKAAFTESEINAARDKLLVSGYQT
jgi:hypothetical protein